MRYLLTGATGMLGSGFASVLDGQVHKVDRADLAPDRVRRFERLLDDHQPEIVLNCAANVDAEGAERSPDAAIYANVLLPQIVATACRRRGIVLVHFSSTGCYGDWKEEPYTETDPLRPTTVHHRTKAAGEEAVRSQASEHIILRTGWLFGGGVGHARNFVWKRLLEASKVSTMQSDASQRGNPTFTLDVVRQTLHLLDCKMNGTFNCVGEGFGRRFDYVREIVRISGLPCRVEEADAFRRQAPVSRNEMAKNDALRLLEINLMPDWILSLRGYIDTLRAWPEWQGLSCGDDLDARR